MTRAISLQAKPAVLTAMLATVFVMSNALCPATEEATGWSAKWITVSDLPEPVTANQWYVFRRSFSLQGVPEKVPCRIACDSKYWLYVNGEQVVFEGQLKRGPTPEDTYCDRLDLAPYLRPDGKNTIAVLLWYFGKDGFSHKDSSLPGLIVEAPAIGIVSDASWRGVKHPAYRAVTADPQPNYRLPESNIRYDARLEFEKGPWHAVDFDDSRWPAVATHGKPPVAPWGKLYLRPIPLWKDYGLREYANADQIPEVSDGSTIECRLPYNAQVTAYLKIDSPAGYVCDMRTDNYQGGSAYNVRSEYIARGGVQEFESPGWFNGHAVHYTFPPGVKILELKFRETGYNSEFAGHFQCDDEFCNTLWEKSRRTLYITMRDTYMDCPDRERAQWWGDAVNELGEAFYALDPRSRLLARKGMYELMWWQREDDTIYSPIPSGNWNKELPMQMLNSVGWYGFWTWYFHCGDAEPIVELYPRVRDYLAVWKLGSDGLVVPRKGDWTWGDWGENKDMPILYNGWYYLALKAQREMARLADARGDIPAIDRKMRSIEENFNATFWNGKEYRSPDYGGKTDDRAHALAVVTGLAEAEQYPAIREVFRKQEHSSPYMEKYVLEALFKMGSPEDAFARMKKRFRPMVESDLTTLWEGWGIGKEGFGGGTINHAWSGGGLTCLSQFAAGISPLEPGYAKWQVRPQMGPLKEIRTIVPTVRGEIHLLLDRDEERFLLEVTVPEETSAEIAIPEIQRFQEISVNGKTPDAPVRPLAVEQGYHWFEVPAGKWTFVYK